MALIAENLRHNVKGLLRLEGAEGKGKGLAEALRKKLLNHKIIEEVPHVKAYAFEASEEAKKGFSSFGSKHINNKKYSIEFGRLMHWGTKAVRKAGDTAEEELIFNAYLHALGAPVPSPYYYHNGEFVREFVEGVPLSVLRGEWISVDIKREVVRELGKTVHVMAEAGLVHADLIPTMSSWNSPSIT